MTPDELPPCRCGARAQRMYFASSVFYVECSTPNCNTIVSVGPICDSPEQAADEWRRLQEGEINETR